MQSGRCLICERIEIIKARTNPYAVAEGETGYVVLGDHQFFHGYTLFLSKLHITELHELDEETRRQFLWEMSEVAGAVFRAFKPRKLNYELLGNQDPHMHWHLIPRHADDPLPNLPGYMINASIRNAESTKPGVAQLAELKSLLARELPATMRRL